MSVEYYIENEQDKIEVLQEYETLIKKSVEETLKFEGFDGDAEVSVTFVDNEEIKEINKEFRDIDKETDVLSFPMEEEFSGGKCILGDIVISLEKAKSQSVEYGHSFERELCFLCVHSTLHLLGYDHVTSNEDEKEMFSKQEEILKQMGMER